MCKFKAEDSEEDASNAKVEKPPELNRSTTTEDEDVLQLQDDEFSSLLDEEEKEEKEKGKREKKKKRVVKRRKKVKSASLDAEEASRRASGGRREGSRDRSRSPFHRCAHNSWHATNLLRLQWRSRSILSSWHPLLLISGEDTATPRRRPGSVGGPQSGAIRRPLRTASARGRSRPSPSGSSASTTGSATAAAPADLPPEPSHPDHLLLG